LIRWDRLTGTRQALISGTHYGEDAMGISDGGGNIAFTSEDPRLVPGDTNTPYTEDVFGYEVAAKAVTRLDLTSTGEQITAGISRALFYGVGGYARAAVFSGDSRWIVFASRGGRVVAGDTNHAADVFLRGPLPVLGGS
jgi:hypothetical protein